MPRKVYVDKNLCIGCQVCNMVAPGSFKMIKLPSGEDKAEEITPHGDDDAKIDEAVTSCPVMAIKDKK